MQVLLCVGVILHKYVMDREAAADVFTVHRTAGSRFIRRINSCSMYKSSTEQCSHLYSSGDVDDDDHYVDVQTVQHARMGESTSEK